jgi:limonene 1,2-monooxygenase
VSRMKFGVFVAPFHKTNDNPTLSIERDIDLIELCDRLGFDEAWVGEHHSTGVEMITDPFMVLSAATQRVVLLDHLSRGRAMLGVGPGALISDADMMGIEPVTQRERMNEALDVILKLLNGEIVDAKTDWFELRDARLALLPYRESGIPVAVASTTTPSGMVAAGRHGLGVLSLSAGFIGGKKNMREQWEIGEKTAGEAGVTMDRSTWRMVLRAHVADDHDQALNDVRIGRQAERSDYFKPVLGLDNDYTLEDEIADDSSLIGTPDEVIAAIERMQEKTDGFGTLLIMSHDWASTEAQHKSFQLFARYVMPHFQGTLDGPKRSAAWVTEKRPSYRPKSEAAITKAFSDAGREIPPGTNLSSAR